MKQLNKIVASMVLVGMVLLGALAGTAYVVQAKSSESEDAQAVTQASVSMNRAIEIALQQVPGNVVGAEFEREDGQSLWEVEILAANKEVYELEIDATSGKVLKQKKDDDDEGEDEDREDEDRD